MARRDTKYDPERGQKLKSPQPMTYSDWETTSTESNTPVEISAHLTNARDSNNEFGPTDLEIQPGTLDSPRNVVVANRYEERLGFVNNNAFGPAETNPFTFRSTRFGSLEAMNQPLNYSDEDEFGPAEPKPFSFGSKRFGSSGAVTNNGWKAHSTPKRHESKAAASPDVAEQKEDDIPLVQEAAGSRIDPNQASEAQVDAFFGEEFDWSWLAEFENPVSTEGEDRLVEEVATHPPSQALEAEAQKSTPQMIVAAADGDDIMWPASFLSSQAPEIEAQSPTPAAPAVQEHRAPTPEFHDTFQMLRQSHDDGDRAWQLAQENQLRTGVHAFNLPTTDMDQIVQSAGLEWHFSDIEDDENDNGKKIRPSKRHTVSKRKLQKR
jgi:hypothetical protein